MMQNEWKSPVLYEWEVKLFLLEHLQFQNLTNSEFQKNLGQDIIPDPRGVQLATIYTRGKVDLASKLAGEIVPASLSMPVYCSFDGIHFQTMYNRYKSVQAVEASSEELKIIHFYFNLVTKNGSAVREEPKADVTLLTEGMVRL